MDRRAKRDIINEICVEILEILEKLDAEWTKKFLQDSYDFISEKQSLGSQIPENKKGRRDLLQAIQFFEIIGDYEFLEWVFSIECFGDSKKFERTVKPSLVSVLKKVWTIKMIQKRKNYLSELELSNIRKSLNFAPAYGEKLRWCLTDPTMKDYWNCVELMIERRIRLE